MIDAIGGKVDDLLTQHKQTSETIISQLADIETRVTIPPDDQRKQHGFAVLLLRKDNSNEYDMRFIAGQASYVRKRAAGLQYPELFIPFTPIANGINLRNNFTKLANARLRDTLGVSVSTVASLLW